MNKIIIGNHKNYMLTNDISEYLKNINSKIKENNVIICPSNIYIPYFLKQNYKVGIQNISLNNIICTGEINSNQASKLGINYVIIGHSERRSFFNEDDILINKKIKDALNSNLKVILCIGETLDQKNFFQTKKILEEQLKKALKDISEFKNIIIAYEPVWAIGTSMIPELDEIRENAIYIKDVLKKLNSNSFILYGGSVSSKNISDLNKIKEIDGFLIGKASTDCQEFLNIIEVVS